MDDFSEMTRYRLHIHPLARRRGLKHAYDLWQRVGGSKESASDIWNGRTSSVSWEMLSRLCDILGCKPGKLFVTEEEFEAQQKGKG